MADIMQLARHSMALKPKYEQTVERAKILQVRPAPKLMWVDDQGHEHHKSNVLFTMNGETFEFPIMNERIIANGVTSFAGCDAYVTISVRKVKHDTKNYKAGDDVASLDRVELSFNNIEAMLTKGIVHVDRN